jgi:hypothetical protein
MLAVTLGLERPSCAEQEPITPTRDACPEVQQRSTSGKRGNTVAKARRGSEGVWVDEQGVAHTVALPKPKQVMTKSFRHSVDSVLRTERAQVETALAAAEEAIFELGMWEPIVPDTETEFEGRPPPAKVLDGVLADAKDLRSAIDAVDIRWRLDVVLALQDYVD